MVPLVIGKRSLVRPEATNWGQKTEDGRLYARKGNQLWLEDLDQKVKGLNTGASKKLFRPKSLFNCTNFNLSSFENFRHERDVIIFNFLMCLF